MRRALGAGLVLWICLATGCAQRPSPPAATQPTATTQPAAPAPIVADDYDALWDAIQATLRARGYHTDFVDYRQGVITSQPLISKQFFEFWRSDTVSAGDVAESSLATVRRTIRFDLHKLDTGQFQAVPQVSVERYALPERRLTSAMLYRGAFRRVRAGSGTTPGVSMSPYWYDIGTDANLERALAKEIATRLAAD